MSGKMGSFGSTLKIVNPVRPGPARVVENALVDTGAELS